MMQTPIKIDLDQGRLFAVAAVAPENTSRAAISIGDGGRAEILIGREAIRLREPRDAGQRQTAAPLP